MLSRSGGEVLFSPGRTPPLAITTTMPRPCISLEQSLSFRSAHSEASRSSYGVSEPVRGSRRCGQVEEMRWSNSQRIQRPQRTYPTSSLILTRSRKPIGNHSRPVTRPQPGPDLQPIAFASRSQGRQHPTPGSRPRQHRIPEAVGHSRDEIGASAVRAVQLAAREHGPKVGLVR